MASLSSVRRAGTVRCGNNINMYIYIYIYTYIHTCTYTYTYTYAYNNINMYIVHTKILHVYGSDSIEIFSSRGEVLRYAGKSPGNSTRMLLVCGILVVLRFASGVDVLPWNHEWHESGEGNQTSQGRSSWPISQAYLRCHQYMH